MRHLTGLELDAASTIICETTSSHFVGVGAFYDEGLGLSCSYMRDMAGGAAAQGRVFGASSIEQESRFGREFASVHALSLVLAYAKEKRGQPDLITACAGDALFRKR